MPAPTTTYGLWAGTLTTAPGDGVAISAMALPMPCATIAPGSRSQQALELAHAARVGEHDHPVAGAQRVVAAGEHHPPVADDRSDDGVRERPLAEGAPQQRAALAHV